METQTRILTLRWWLGSVEVLDLIRNNEADEAMRLTTSKYRNVYEYVYLRRVGQVGAARVEGH